MKLKNISNKEKVALTVAISLILLVAMDWFIFYLRNDERAIKYIIKFTVDSFNKKDLANTLKYFSSDYKNDIGNLDKQFIRESAYNFFDYKAKYEVEYKILKIVLKNKNMAVVKLKLGIFPIRNGKRLTDMISLLPDPQVIYVLFKKRIDGWIITRTSKFYIAIDKQKK